jgi:replicative DNA helicase
MAQLNRGVETRADKRPNMADLRSSGEIEQDAAVVGLLYREGYYQPQPPASDTLEVNIAKNRDGAVGVASTTIEPPYSRIGGVLALPSMRAVRTGTDDAPF